jgi:putative NADH-flavin reductase
MAQIVSATSPSRGQKMRLLVLGSTGRLGHELVSQALEQGHDVTAFARTPDKLKLNHPKLKVVQGDVLETSTVKAAVLGQDAVISALGVGESFKSESLISRSMPVIVEAMETQGVGRLIFTSGIILKLDVVPLFMRLLMRLLMRDLMRDKKAGEDLLRQSRLEWTLVYPVRMTGGPKSGRYRSGERLKLTGIPRVARADVADLILKQLADRGSIHKDIIVST